MRSLLFFGSMLFAGCTPAGIINYPLVGKFSDGSTARGSLWVDIVFGFGTFEWHTVRGPSCTGDFDALDLKSTISIRVTCDDGQSGMVIATSNGSRLIAVGFNGTAGAKLDNGLTGKFIFGNVPLKDQAEFLD